MATTVTDTSLVTRRELAERCAVHMQTVTKWEHDGCPIVTRGRKGKPSLYREADVRLWLASREAAASPAQGGLDVAQERARKDRAQAVLAEQMYATRERELLPRTEVERLWVAEQSAIRTKLLAIPTAYADRVHRAGTLGGVAGVERELHDAVYDVLRELAVADRAPGPGDDGQRQAA